MSLPISTCDVYRAAKGDEEAYQRLVHAFEVNVVCGHYSQFPCMCNPPCELCTEEQGIALNTRLAEQFKDKYPVGSDGGAPGVQGT